MRLATIVSVACTLLLAACAGMLQVQGGSMQPTIRDGERVTYERYQGTSPQRGDIVVVQKGNSLRIRRVIGLPGEIVRIVDGGVLVGGSPLSEPYLSPETRTDSPRDTFAVPAEAYFVLGDNRGAASDSRDPGFGFVTRSEILGKIAR